MHEVSTARFSDSRRFWHRKRNCEAFVAKGARVCVCDIDVTAMETAAKDIPGLITEVCDVSKRQDSERVVVAAVKSLGRLDVLVNNAGISGPTAPVEDMASDAWEMVMNVDLTGTFNVTRLAIPHLKKSNAGVIINMSSVAGRFGYANRSPYCTAKWGLIGGEDCFFICYNNYCAHFSKRKECLFCNLVDTSRKYRSVITRKQADQIGETAAAAFREGVARHILMTGGCFGNEKEVEVVETILTAVRKHTGFDRIPGTLLPSPPEDLASLRRYRDAGIEAVAFSLEIWDEPLYRALCPGKAGDPACTATVPREAPGTRRTSGVLPKSSRRRSSLLRSTTAGSATGTICSMTLLIAGGSSRTRGKIKCAFSVRQLLPAVTDRFRLRSCTH